MTDPNLSDTETLYPTWVWGLLVIRVGLGLAFMWHGAPKLFGGPETWISIGKMGMGSLGIHVWPTFWGFMAGLAEFGGGCMLVLGILYRSSLGLLIFTMVAAIAFHLVSGKGSPIHALESLIVFASLLLLGPGPITASRFFTRS